MVSYDLRQGDRRGTDTDFYDFTYDGLVSDGQLSGGLGQLADYEIGNTNFRLDSQNLGRKGYEWVGWRNDSASQSFRVNIVFRFDQVLYAVSDYNKWSSCLLLVCRGLLTFVRLWWS